MQSTMEHLGVESEQLDPNKRRYNDTVTWLAETLNGGMHTSFEYRFNGYELYASDGGALEPIFDDAIEAARSLPGYELRRRRIEKQEYCDMIAMMKGDLGNTMVVISDFPPELMNATMDVGGYNVSRKQTMLRVLIRTAEGTLKMYSQSLDGSNRRALEAIRNSFGYDTEPGELLGQRMHLELGAYEQEFLIDRLTGVYDRSLKAQYGGEWYAGQLNGRKLNTYDFVCQQKDLLNAYLATTDHFTGGFKDYSLAAAMKDLYLGRITGGTVTYQPGSPEAFVYAQQVMYQSGMQAQARGESFSGCGLSVGNNQNSSAQTQLEAAGMGNQADKPSSNTSEKLVWKDGVCRIDNCPTRPGKTKVAQCSICRGCQYWFDKGRDPSKLYKGIKRVQKESFTVQFGRRRETKFKRKNNE